MIGADHDPAEFHFVSLNQSTALPLQGSTFSAASQRGLLLMVSPVRQPFWPRSGRISTYPAVQISRASSTCHDIFGHAVREILVLAITAHVREG